LAAAAAHPAPSEDEAGAPTIFTPPPRAQPREPILAREESARLSQQLVDTMVKSLNQGALERQAEDEGTLMRFPAEPPRKT
jgi:hypothetical protein